MNQRRKSEDQVLNKKENNIIPMTKLIKQEENVPKQTKEFTNCTVK